MSEDNKEESLLEKIEDFSKGVIAKVTGHEPGHGEEGHVHDDHCHVPTAPVSDEMRRRPVAYTPEQLQEFHDEHVANETPGTTATDGVGVPDEPKA